MNAAPDGPVESLIEAADRLERALADLRRVLRANGPIDLDAIRRALDAAHRELEHARYRMSNSGR